MKTTTTLLTLALLSTNLFSQNYTPFPDSNATWVNAFYEEIWFPSNPFPTLVLFGVANYCVDGNDTTINSISYSQIHRCGGSYKGGLRDANGKVYFIPKDSLQEYLLYDFTANSGDTISDVYIEDFAGNATLNQIIIDPNSVDSILINGNFRKRIRVQAGYWIEGIGNTQGLFWEPWVNISQYSLDLNCMSVNNTTIYPAFAASSCSLNLGIDEQGKNISGLSVYPNPTDGKFTIQWDQKYFSSLVSIINPLGQIINPVFIFENNKMEINLGDYPAGIYSIMIITGSNIVTQKIIRN